MKVAFSRTGPSLRRMNVGIRRLRAARSRGKRKGGTHVEAWRARSTWTASTSSMRPTSAPRSNRAERSPGRPRSRSRCVRSKTTTLHSNDCLPEEGPAANSACPPSRRFFQVDPRPSGQLPPKRPEPPPAPPVLYAPFARIIVRAAQLERSKTVREDPWRIKSSGQTVRPTSDSQWNTSLPRSAPPSARRRGHERPDRPRRSSVQRLRARIPSTSSSARRVHGCPSWSRSATGG